MLRLDSGLILSSLLGLLGLGACGGVSRVDHPGLGNEAAGSSSGGANSAGRGGDEVAGTAAGGSSAAGASAAGASAAGASACSRFSDEAPQSVTVTLHNDTLVPVYIGPRMQTCGATPLYEVRDASNTVVSERGPCGNPCQGWLDGNPIGGCPAICLLPSVTKLAPGETIVSQWSGLSVLDTQLPKACNASQLAGQGDVNCSVDKRIEPGFYDFLSTAGSDFTCSGIPDGCGACVPAATGGCIVNGATVAGSEISAAAQSVHLDASYGISGSSGGGNNDGGQNRSVELFFRLLP
jgi:hypothetical protein